MARPLHFLTFFGLLCSVQVFSLVNNPTTIEISARSINDTTIREVTALFQENFDRNFSWNDPELAKLLSRDQVDSSESNRTLAKRVNGTPFGIKIPKTGSLLTFPQCIGCADAAFTDDWIIDDFTVDFFLKTRLIPIEDLRDKCVFYTKRRTANLEKGSIVATSWACDLDPKLRTIWNLWPYNTATDTGNFWVILENELDGPRNWLYNVWYEDYIWKMDNEFDDHSRNQGAINTYFSRMSQAMALSCSGTVYVMTDDPHNLPTGGIWPLIEYPTLQYQYNSGIVEKCFAIPYDNPGTQSLWVEIPLTGWFSSDPPPSRKVSQMMDFNWTTHLSDYMALPVRKRTWEERKEEDFRSRMRDLHERRSLTERDACLGGQPYELPGHDYFGEGN